MFKVIRHRIGIPFARNSFAEFSSMFPSKRVARGITAMWWFLAVAWLFTVVFTFDKYLVVSLNSYYLDSSDTTLKYVSSLALDGSLLTTDGAEYPPGSWTDQYPVSGAYQQTMYSPRELLVFIPMTYLDVFKYMGFPQWSLLGITVIYSLVMRFVLTRQTRLVHPIARPEPLGNATDKPVVVSDSLTSGSLGNATADLSGDSNLDSLINATSDLSKGSESHRVSYSDVLAPFAVSSSGDVSRLRVPYFMVASCVSPRGYRWGVLVTWCLLVCNFVFWSFCLF